MGLDQEVGIINAGDIHLAATGDLDDRMEEYKSLGVYNIQREYRKCPNLNGIMEKLWRERFNKGTFYPGSLMNHPDGNFNRKWFLIDDYILERLKKDTWVSCTGFFWGSNTMNRDDLLDLITFHLDKGDLVVYRCSW